MYFRDVPIRENLQRRTLYTNANFEPSERVDLDIGHLVPDTDSWAAVRTVTAHFIERLETKQEDGSDEFLVSTGAHAIAEDLATVLSFSLDATFTTNHQDAIKLIQQPSGSHRNPTLADVLPRTFAPDRLVSSPEVDALRDFLSNLLSLRRSEYERAMRTMRRVIAAGRRIIDDPTLAYTDYIAALEALSAGFEPPTPTWDRLDQRRRSILDPVLSGLEQEAQNSVRSAILRAERAGIKYRYVEFIKQNIRPSFFREEAVGVQNPVRQDLLSRAASAAYDARSKSVHELQTLEIGLWLLVGGAHTAAAPAGDRLMLTHAGLHNLSRHVVRTFVSRASKELDRKFRWRDNLPNLQRVQLSPELYIANPAYTKPNSAHLRACEFYGIAIEAISGRQKLAVDLRPVLAKIEILLGTQRKPEVRKPLLAIYFLWHNLLPPEFHMEAPEKLLGVARVELQKPSLHAFATGLLLGLEPPWTIDELLELVESREETLMSAKLNDLPARIDTALWICAARRLQQEEAHDLACTLISKAVGTSPGDPIVIALERSTNLGESISINLHEFTIGSRSECPDSSETTQAASK